MLHQSDRSEVGHHVIPSPLSAEVESNGAAPQSLFFRKFQLSNQPKPGHANGKFQVSFINFKQMLLCYPALVWFLHFPSVSSRGMDLGPCSIALKRHHDHRHSYKRKHLIEVASSFRVLVHFHHRELGRQHVGSVSLLLPL